MLAGVTPMTADLRHLHHLLRRFGLGLGQTVVVIHSGSFLCGLVGVTGWWLGVPEHWLFAAFVVSLLSFIAWTNAEWKRIDLAQASPQVV